MSKTPKISLINPKSPPAMWYPLGFARLFDKAFCPNLALPTLAALVPEGFAVEVWDENLGPLPEGEAPEIVALTGYSTQAERMLALGDRFRARGSLVCMGGIHATCVTEEAREHADVVFLGEAEGSWPRFLADYLAGRHQETYAQESPTDLSEAPPPDVRHMGAESYLIGPVQTSRGCPHECEFCSVVELLGHKIRRKPPERTVAECEALYRSGHRNLFLTDDNFFASRRHARGTLEALADWNGSHREGTDFIMQSTVDIAQETPLLQLLLRAGVKTLFVGVESDDPESLREVNKGPNLGRDLAEDLRAMSRQGLFLYPGLIVGFDHDGVGAFERAYDFIQRSASLMPMIVPLMAAPGTKLEARVKAEGRWRGPTATHSIAETLATNITPAGMSYDELIEGYLALMKRVYSPGAFLERLLALEALWPAGAESAVTSTAPKGLPELISDTFSLLAPFGPEHRRTVKESFRVAMRNPAQSHNIFLCLMFWQHILCLIEGWSGG